MKSVSFEHFLAFTTQYLFLASLLDSQSLANRTDNSKIPTKNCDFKRCLCSYNRATDRHYLYCNDPDTVTLPDFSINNRSSLTFAKLDFTNSGIRNISETDFRSLTLDILSSKKTPEMQLPHTEHFETMLDHLKKTMIPIYHLDFDGIEFIGDGAFQSLLINSIKLNSEVIEKPNDFLLLKIRFQNSLFDYYNLPTAQPFRGLLAKKLYFTNIRNAFIADSVFFGSIISEMFIENSANFMGFSSSDKDRLSNILLHKLTVFNSFSVKHLSSDMLPGFVSKQTFYEVVIKRCSSLEELKAFTFVKYPRLKTLILANNAFTRLDKYSFSGLKDLHTLDLAFNPLSSLEEFIFNDCTNLKILILESTRLKTIGSNSFKGLFSLNKLKLSKSRLLSKIENNAFADMKASLAEIHLKDTAINLVEQIQENGSDPPYPKKPEQNSSHFWLDGLNLTILNINNLDLPATNQHLILCKFLRYIPETVLVYLNRDQECNSLVYLIYRSKKFPKNWEYRTPACYRSQITIENETKSYEKIKTKENEFTIDTLDADCFLSPTTTTEATITTKRPTSYKPAEPVVEKQKDQIKLPKLNMLKLTQVAAVVCLITLLAIVMVWFIYRLKRDIKKKQLKRTNAVRNSSSTNSAFYSALTADSSPTKKQVILPPNVIPKFDSKVDRKRSSAVSTHRKLSKLNSNASNNSPGSGSRQQSRVSVAATTNAQNRSQIRPMSSFGRTANNSRSNSEQSSVQGLRELGTSI